MKYQDRVGKMFLESNMRFDSEGRFDGGPFKQCKVKGEFKNWKEMILLNHFITLNGLSAATADDLFSVLMGEDVELRRSFIQRNAKDVRFLDI